MIDTSCVWNATGLGKLVVCANTFSEGVFFPLLLFGFFMVFVIIMSARYSLPSSVVLGCFLVLIIGTPLLTMGVVSLWYLAVYGVIMALAMLYQAVSKAS